MRLLITENVAARGDHDVPEARAHGGRRARRTSRGPAPRRGSAPRPGRPSTDRQAASTSRRRPPGSTRAGTAPRPPAARPRRRARGGRRRRSGRRAASRPCRGRRPRRSGRRGGSDSRSCSAAASIIGELLLPRRRGDAVPVAGPVEVAVVQVGQRGGARGRQRGGEPLAHLVRTHELARRAAPRGSAPSRRSRACSTTVVCTPASASCSSAVVCGCQSSGSTCLDHCRALSRSSVPGIRR